jgi:four helix bundle protein
MANLRGFRDLMVWQKTMTLAEAVYKTTRQFPKDELYGMVSQMRRAAV